MRDVLRMGGVVVPMNPLLKAREVDRYVTDSGASSSIASAALPPGQDGPRIASARRSAPDRRLQPLRRLLLELVRKWRIEAGHLSLSFDTARGYHV